MASFDYVIIGGGSAGGLSGPPRLGSRPAGGGFMSSGPPKLGGGAAKPAETKPAETTPAATPIRSLFWIGDVCGSPPHPIRR